MKFCAFPSFHRLYRSTFPCHPHHLPSSPPPRQSLSTHLNILSDMTHRCHGLDPTCPYFQTTGPDFDINYRILADVRPQPVLGNDESDTSDVLSGAEKSDHRACYHSCDGGKRRLFMDGLEHMRRC
jgi:hypothetical protein